MVDWFLFCIFVNLIMRKYSKIGIERRKNERIGYGEFFEKHVEIIKNSKAVCLECSSRLIGDVSEVAHILPKSTFKSLATDDENVIYLCSWKNSKNCHSIFDSTNEQLQSLKIFPEIRKLVIEKLLDKVTENYNWKLTDRWKVT